MMKRPCAFVLLLACVLQCLNPCHAYRDQRHVPQRSAVYDVEVREVDSATLRQILAGQRVQQNQYRNPGFAPQTPNPNLYPNGQWVRQQGQQTKAVFVSPTGQVYQLKEMNGMQVLVGPDGRWHPLNNNDNNNNNNNNNNNMEPSRPGEDRGGNSSPSRDDATTSGPIRHPPGPSTPGSYADDSDPTYDRGGGGPKGTRDAEDCVASQTTFNGGRKACQYQLLLDEHFDVLNLTLWKHDVLIPEDPNFEFVVYDKDPDNSYVQKSILHIKPTILEDSYGPGFVMNGSLNLDGCTATRREHCARTASTYRVLPAVRSARLTTRDTFTFRYGIVEMRVLVPAGDWIYPAITLEPASSMYGKYYSGGQIRMPYTVGNRFLSKRTDGPKTGLQVMRAGVAIGKAAGEDIMPVLIEKELRAGNNSNWRKKHFRVYRMKWTPEFIEFSLDGKPMGQVRPPPGGFVSMTGNPSDHPWRAGTNMAPFDQEFFMSLAVGVGGVNRFADGSANGEYGEHPKPWKNSSPKALLDFYKARDHWIPTWSHPALEIAHIKIWAL